MIQSIEVIKQDENSYLICGNCKVKVYPFHNTKFCSCGNIAVDEEKSTDKVIYLKDYQSAKFTATSEYKPTFKERLMNIFKGKKLC